MNFSCIWYSPHLMQHRCKHLSKRALVRREQDFVCIQPDLATPGVWVSALFHAHAGYSWPVEISFPNNLDNVSKPAAEENLVEIQECFDDQIRAPPMPFTCTYRVLKTADSGCFTSPRHPSQAVLLHDLSVCAMATDVFSAMMSTEMSGPIDISL